jgi:FkbM family methyltransferase
MNLKKKFDTSNLINLINSCRKEFYLLPKERKTKIYNKYFLNFYKKKINKNFVKFKYNKYKSIKFPAIKMGKVNSYEMLYFHEHLLFLFYYLGKHKYNYQNVADIGANMGIHSIILSLMGYNVESFEPDPNHFKNLKRNIKLNSCGNIKIRNKGVLDKNKSFFFTRVKNNPQANHLTGRKELVYGKLETIKVKCINILNIIHKFDLIKIDSEGSEKEIIKKIRKKHLKNCDISCEISGKKNAKEIYNHCNKNNINIYSQKIGWAKATKISDVPVHHSEGIVFITIKKNFFDFI